MLKKKFITGLFLLIFTLGGCLGPGLGLASGLGLGLGPGPETALAQTSLSAQQTPLPAQQTPGESQMPRETQVFSRQPLAVAAAVEISREALAAGQANVVRFSGDVVIKPGEVVQGNVVAMQGDIDVGGRVLGNVTALAGNITLRAGSHVNGNVVALAGDVHREQGAQVLGQITTREEIRTPAGQYYLPPAHRAHPGEPFWSRVGGWFLFLLGLLALTAIVMALFPEKMNAMRNSLAANPARHLAVGFLGWIALPVALLAVALTFVGIPVAVAAVLALPVVVLIGAVLLGLIVGEQVERALAKRWPRAAGQTLLVQALIGIALLWLAQAVPLVGWLIWPLAAVFGLGAVLATRFGTNRPWFNGRGPKLPPAPDSGGGAPENPPADEKQIS